MGGGEESGSKTSEALNREWAALNQKDRRPVFEVEPSKGVRLGSSVLEACIAHTVQKQANRLQNKNLRTIRWGAFGEHRVRLVLQEGRWA